MKQKTRQDILKINEVFTTHLIDVQITKHDPSNYEYSERERVILDDSGKCVILTKEKANELNAENRDYFNSNKDINPFDLKTDVKWIDGTTLISSKTDASSYLIDIGEALETLRKKLGSKNLIVMGDWITPWLYQDNDYKPVKEVLDWLKKQIDSDFNGGFLLRGIELIQFIPKLFWLIRCNASLPEFMMTFENCKTIFSICKYGVLHIESYDQDELNYIFEFFSGRRFRQVDDCCNNPVNFDNFNGRKILI